MARFESARAHVRSLADFAPALKPLRRECRPSQAVNPVCKSGGSEDPKFGGPGGSQPTVSGGRLAYRFELMRIALPLFARAQRGKPFSRKQVADSNNASQVADLTARVHAPKSVRNSVRQKFAIQRAAEIAPNCQADSRHSGPPEREAVRPYSDRPRLARP